MHRSKKQDNKKTPSKASIQSSAPLLIDTELVNSNSDENRSIDHLLHDNVEKSCASVLIPVPVDDVLLSREICPADEARNVVRDEKKKQDNLVMCQLISNTSLPTSFVSKKKSIEAINETYAIYLDSLRVDGCYENLVSATLNRLRFEKGFVQKHGAYILGIAQGRMSVWYQEYADNNCAYSIK